jgi:hypothetical protein
MAPRGTLGTGAGIGAVLLGIVALLWLFGGARELQRSAAGFAGLVVWLDENGIDARTFDGQGYLVRGEVGLRVLPLYDTDLAADRVPPATSEEVVAQTSEVDLDGSVVAAKVELLPTLLVLPKWRTGMRMLGAAHPDLLIPEDELARLIGQIRGLRGQVRRAADYVEFSVPGNAARVGLYHPQTLADSGCEPLIGTAEDMLLGRCLVPAGKAGAAHGGSASFWLLADPDLMDTHGLARAGNAALALDLVREMAAGRPVVLDLSTEVLTVERTQPDEAPDGWKQAARLFAWPFAMVWIGFAAVSALVLWRALMRYGPVARLYEDAPRASREVSIEAKARLLRLARHDRALLTAYIRQRLAEVAAELTGPHLPAGADPLSVLTRLAGRRSSALAEELAEAARLPEYRRDWPDVLLRRLQRFETALAKVRDEFGRASGARG